MKIHLVEELKANMLVSTDIMMPEQFVPDLNQKTAIVRSYSCSFNLDIEISRVSIQCQVHDQTKATILPYTTQGISIYHLNIPRSKDFFFSQIMLILQFWHTLLTQI